MASDDLPGTMHLDDGTPLRSRLYSARVCRTERISPSFIRLTLEGPELGRVPVRGLDDQVKLVLSDPDLVPLPDPGTDWYRHWRAEAADRQIAVRTYTISRARPEQDQLEVVLVLHEGGRIGSWAESARRGQRLALITADPSWTGEPVGVKFRPARDRDHVVLVADSSALPAVSNIVGQLDIGARGVAIVEVRAKADCWGLCPPSGVRLQWVVRGTGEPSELATIVTDEVTRFRRACERAAAPYAWVAAEFDQVRAVRRALRRAWNDRVTGYYSAYWRAGHEGS